MQKAVSEGAVRVLVVIRCVEFVKAVPAKLILALGALHELAALRPDDIDVAARADLAEAEFVQVPKQVEFAPVPSL